MVAREVRRVVILSNLIGSDLPDRFITKRVGGGRAVDTSGAEGVEGEGGVEEGEEEEEEVVVPVRRRRRKRKKMRDDMEGAVDESCGDFEKR